jgi:Nucleotide modification associated domain 2
MTLYSYVVTHDTGFSPNPFFGYCTLACCKPEIRRNAQVGDWIVGLTPRAQGNKVVYFMRVDEIVDFPSYWTHSRFLQKRPRYDGSVQAKCGDNIYEPLPNGEFRQLRSMHSKGEAEDPERKAHDLGGSTAQQSGVSNAVRVRQRML